MASVFSGCHSTKRKAGKRPGIRKEEEQWVLLMNWVHKVKTKHEPKTSQKFSSWSWTNGGTGKLGTQEGLAFSGGRQRTK